MPVAPKRRDTLSALAPFHPINTVPPKALGHYCFSRIVASETIPSPLAAFTISIYDNTYAFQIVANGV